LFENLSAISQANVGPIKHIVASIFGVHTAKKEPKPTAVFVAIKMKIAILM